MGALYCNNNTVFVSPQQQASKSAFNTLPTTTRSLSALSNKQASQHSTPSQQQHGLCQPSVTSKQVFVSPQRQASKSLSALSDKQASQHSTCSQQQNQVTYTHSGTIIFHHPSKPRTIKLLLNGNRKLGCSLNAFLKPNTVRKKKVG